VVAVSVLVITEGGFGQIATTTDAASAGTSAATTTLTTVDTWPYDRCAPNTPPELVASICYGPPPTEKIPANNGSKISFDRALEIADALSGPDAPAASQPPVAKQMTYGEASVLLQQFPNHSVSPQATVWVVTVHRPPAFISAPPNVSVPEFTVYSVIMNAADGQPIDMCSGCTALQ
jgi:hypothetical protein